MKKPIYLILLALLTFSCGSGNPASSGLDGTYALDSVSFDSNGITFTLGPPQIIGIMTLEGSRYNVSLSSLDGPDDVENGSFAVSGSMIIFTPDEGESTVTGEVIGAFITITDSFVDPDGESVTGTMVFVKT